MRKVILMKIIKMGTLNSIRSLISLLSLKKRKKSKLREMNEGKIALKNQSQFLLLISVSCGFASQRDNGDNKNHERKK